MSQPHLEYLRHILNEINFIMDQSCRLELEDFLTNEVLKRAIVRSLEIIGEAVKRLPAEIRERYSEIDWRATTGTCDKLIHDYFGIDYEIVWDVVSSEIPRPKE